MNLAVFQKNLPNKYHTGFGHLAIVWQFLYHVHCFKYGDQLEVYIHFLKAEYLQF